MARYHYETRRDAERKFPHRVDIPMPENGLGKQLNDMIDWCGGRFAEWTFHGVTGDRDERGIAIDLVRFYFMDEMAAQKFRERWATP
jgi:hypothetical protein